MKYGPEKTKEISDHISKGLGRVDACILADISYETFTQWMQRAEFAEAIKKAESGFKGANLQIIQKAANRSWQAAAWLLERKFKDEFASQQHHDYSGSVNLKVIAYDRNNDPIQLRSEPQALPASSATGQSEIQVVSNSSQGGKDGAISEQVDPGKSAPPEEGVLVRCADV